ncbi:extracellular solute-binding protein [Cellulomonas fimi]|uniref:Extracellular solute-binding protein n=1 Tax=Cellulomonas fimi TaxID=1708 RepID=A0A7Y0LZ59_CELFI|nr:extracellular solute-binding protein [Cellulomonas fimi]NMR19402.1 extracellular solute-binding protein [Cellulomonas fimi]
MHGPARTTVVTGLLAASALALTGCGGGSGFDDGGGDGGGEGEATGGGLRVLIGSSGDAETDAVTQALAAWSEQSGTEATLSVASNLPQELSQGFAGGDPPDVFYASPEGLPGWAANGSVVAYGSELPNADDFYPSLVENFTIDDQFYCAPKDFSTLALVINTAAWTEAGLTDADFPTDWASLRDVAQRLTSTDRVGLTFGPEYQRVGVFMEQAGGGLLDDDGATAIADSPENVEALTFVKELLADGVLAYPSQIDAGWGGEAFGLGKAAMTIEGNWIIGALTNDFPDVQYRVIELPAGPAGQGTLQFTNCWGIAADSPNQEAARDLVEFLTSTEQQVEFTKAFGVMPSVESAAEQFSAEFPEQEAFIASADFATGIPPLQGFTDVVADFNGQIEALETGDPQQILAGVQTNLEAALGSAG